VSQRILIVSQVYVPDPASVGQHLHDAASEMVRRGYRVKVVASSRGYDDPSRRYPRRESIEGVDVLRVPTVGLGKRSLASRLVGQLVFLARAFFSSLLTRDLGMVLVTTSPPMCSAVALAVSAIHRVPLVYWVMDINPDQAVATGLLGRHSLLVFLLERLNRLAMRRAAAVVTLDRFMADRLSRKVGNDRGLFVMPPWPHEEYLVDIPHGQNPFRTRLHLDGRFVFMYSGNHAITSPIATLLQAAERLRGRRDIVFVFVGGGVRKREVDKAISEGAPNVVSLPYQPLESLGYCLSAADVHVVTLDRRAVGIVHPCKVYGAMATGRPILFVGPAVCHVSEILAQHSIGTRVEEGDLEAAVRAITELADTRRSELARMGHTAKRVVEDHLSKDTLCRGFVDIVEYSLTKGDTANTNRPRKPSLQPLHDPARTGDLDVARR